MGLRMQRIGQRIALAMAASLLGLSIAATAQAQYRGHRPPWVYDTRHHHDYYYPARGSVMVTLPPSYLQVYFGRDVFFFSSGVWYRRTGPRYIVVAPPPGVVVPVLPQYYTVVSMNGVPYYYANDVYYMPAQNGYVVVEPPQGVVSPAPAPAPPVQQPATPPAANLFVYPRTGQSPAQIDTDRAECDRWAAGQLGYDSARAVANDPQLRADYQRAVSACLEGRGYTVR